jgi:hypothetical protein
MKGAVMMKNRKLLGFNGKSDINLTGSFPRSFNLATVSRLNLADSFFQPYPAILFYFF